MSVGVTGTNGKSTTTSYVAELLAELSRPVACCTTLGFFVGGERQALEPGYPAFIETLRRARVAGGRGAAIEMTSEALGRGFIRAWPCQYGVFTNLTRDHLDSHGSAEHYLASKAQLFTALPLNGGAVLNAADPASELLGEVIPAGVATLRYAVPSRGTLSGHADLLARDLEIGWQGSRARVETSGTLLGAGEFELGVSALGEIYLENALAAYAAARLFGVAHSTALAVLARAAAPSGRFELLSERPWVVLDYAHTPDALARTLTTARGLCEGRLWLVFGAGGNRDKPKRPLMGKAASEADFVILTSDNPRDEDPGVIAAEIRAGLKPGPDISEELDRARAISIAVERAKPEDVVLIAGKGHETEQKVSGETRHFSDREVALEAFRQRG